ncbi:hypothetical protein [Rahnella inusitata]|uniref:hypothetical protein n=1 Tax=Rahnella inusitata TaxID=58169 RepID=UPI000E6BDFB1
MYEYTDVYEEVECWDDGQPLILSRREVINYLKLHYLLTAKQWFEFFGESENICKNQYPAKDVLIFLGY